MARSCSILQKKLQELESLLHDVVSLPPEAPRNPNPSRDVELRIIFLKTLLTAEISSGPKQPHYLSRIAHRLTELEAAFHQWDSGHSNSIMEPAEEAILDGDDDDINVETVSTCSCTESCLNDAGEAEEAELEEEAEEEVSGERRLGEEEGEGEGKGVRRAGKEKTAWVRVLVGGFAISASFMCLFMVSFFGLFDHAKEDCCLMPT